MDWYLDELVSEMEVLTEKEVSIPTLWRSLHYCGITRKKVKFKECLVNSIILLFTDEVYHVDMAILLWVLVQKKK